MRGGRAERAPTYRLGERMGSEVRNLSSFSIKQPALNPAAGEARSSQRRSEIHFSPVLGEKLVRDDDASSVARDRVQHGGGRAERAPT